MPQTEINTLANILAACVNSTGPSSTQCTTLFSNAASSAFVTTDTATAALNIAHNPGPNSTVVGNLFGLQTAHSPFQSGLTSAPNDFTIAISYTGGGLNSPVPLAIDASGDVWVGNTASGANTVSEFSPLGAVISGSPFSGGGIDRPLQSRHRQIRQSLDGERNPKQPQRAQLPLACLSLLPRATPAAASMRPTTSLSTRSATSGL